MDTNTGKVTNETTLTFKFDDLRSGIASLTAKFEAASLSFHPQGSLGTLFSDASKFLTLFETAPNTTLSNEELLAVIDAFRVVAALLAQDFDNPIARKNLDVITKKSVELSKPERSHGKDYLFEFEMFNRIRTFGHSVRLEEPDLVADFGFGEYALACKKMNSLNGIEDRLRSGKNQLKNLPIPGVIALNIDSYVTLEEGLRVKDPSELSKKAEQFISEFCKETSRDLRRIRNWRVDGIFISLTLPGLVRQGDKWAIYKAEQATLWYTEDKKLEALPRLTKVFEAMKTLVPRVDADEN
jgi:hypothetical protein